MRNDDEELEDDLDDENYDAGRYESSFGWEPDDKYKKLRDDHRKKDPELFSRETMLETKTADEWRKAGAAYKPPTNLFGEM